LATGFSSSSGSQEEIAVDFLKQGCVLHEGKAKAKFLACAWIQVRGIFWNHTGYFRLV